MSAELKSELRIPDLWFDFYARLIPGAVFAALGRVFLLGRDTVPEASEMVAIVAIGYFAALITQPLASFFTELFEWLAAGRKESGATVIQRKLGTTSRSSLILSKMHGETTLFMQLAMLSLLYLAIDRYLFLGRASSLPLWTGCLALFLALEVARRRLRRVKRYEEAVKAVPKEGESKAVQE